MSFLSLAFLAALPLAAAPLLLHLFDRRRNVAIDWGAMQFLLEAATHRTRARRFQHWLLLLLRVLAVTALVLALARPLAKSDWLEANQRHEVVLAIDNSMSTLQRKSPQTATTQAGDSSTKSGQSSSEVVVFDELLARAEKTINDLESGNAVRILLTSPYPAWATPASVRLNASSRSELVDVLHRLRPTQGTSDLPAALLKAVQSDLEDYRLVGRNVMLFTDGQRNDWRTGDLQAWSRFSTALHESSVPTTVEVIEAGASQPVAENLAVTRLRANRTVVGVDQPFSVTAEIRNFAAAQSKACPINWFIDEQKHSASSLPALASGETRDVALKHSFTRPGVHVLDCRLDPGDKSDTLAADNVQSIVIEVVERVPILLVEAAEDFAELQQDAYLVRAALGQTEADQTQSWRAVFEPHTVAPRRLESIGLSDYRAVVIPNLDALSVRAVERLTEFVTDGGGLWLALGPRTNITAFNDHVFNSGDGLSPVGLARVVDEAADALQKPTINPFLKSHTATSDLANNDQLDLDDVQIERRFRFQMPLAAEQVSVLLDLSNGDPLVVENRLGRGRVLVQGVPLRYQWSELAVSQAFVVMVHNWLSYLTEPGATQHNLLPGETIALQVADSQEPHATLLTPSGEDIAVAGEPLPDGLLFRTSRTASPGNYVLEIGLTGGKVPFHVARDAAESDLAALTPEDRTFLAQAAGLSDGRAVAQATGGATRSAIWPGLLVLLILLMTGDLLLSGVIARKRFGTASISDTAEDLANQESLFTGIALGNVPRPQVAGMSKTMEVREITGVVN